MLNLKIYLNSTNLKYHRIRKFTVESQPQIAQRVQAGELSLEQITETTLSESLATSAFPDPELMIRTSGECRISNFLLYQLAYAELYFTETRWPEFRKEHLVTALLDYQSRERRFGKTSAQVQTDNV